MKNPLPPVRVPIAESGFTILELMITVSVLAVLLGIGVPSFNAIIRQNRLAAHTNHLLAAVAVARSEAVKRGALVSMCAANEALNDCADDDVWSNGWIVFSDDVGTVGEIDVDGTVPDDTIVQVWPASTQQRITVRNDGVNFISYRGDGATTLGVGDQTVFTVVGDNCVNPRGARAVTVVRVGRAGSAPANCPG